MLKSGQNFDVHDEREEDINILLCILQICFHTECDKTNKEKL